MSNPDPYAYPPPPAHRPETNGLAVTSFVLGITALTIGLVVPGVTTLAGLLAIVFGHLALGGKHRHKTGRGLAIAGLVLGYIVAAIVGIGVLFALAAYSNGW